MNLKISTNLECFSRLGLRGRAANLRVVSKLCNEIIESSVSVDTANEHH